MSKNYIPRKKRSKLWALSSDEFSKIVSSGKSNTEILKTIGIAVCGGNRAALVYRASLENLSLSHIPKGTHWALGKKGHKKKYDYSIVFAINSAVTRTHLKTLMLRDNLVNNECAICHMTPEWLGKALSFVLDHINGNSTDNRLENLRLLCPNCNSQTDTFSWKNMWRKKREKESQKNQGMLKRYHMPLGLVS